MENVDTMDTVAFDTEGFLVCAIHVQRRKSWRSLPDGTGIPRWNLAQFTPLENERFVVFGTTIYGSQVGPRISEVEDRRDNRDPTLVGIQAIYELKQYPPKAQEGSVLS